MILAVCLTNCLNTKSPAREAQAVFLFAWSDETERVGNTNSVLMKDGPEEQGRFQNRFSASAHSSWNTTHPHRSTAVPMQRSIPWNCQSSPLSILQREERGWLSVHTPNRASCKVRKLKLLKFLKGFFWIWSLSSFPVKRKSLWNYRNFRQEFWGA